MGFWTWIWSADTVDWGRKWLVDFNAGETQLVSFEGSSWCYWRENEWVCSWWKIICWVWLSLPNWIGALTLFLLLKLPPRKTGALIRSIKFISLEVALYLYKSTIRPCMKYCCHFWAGASTCYLELLDKLQKRICRTVGPSLATSPEPLVHCRNVASLRLL